MSVLNKRWLWVAIAAVVAVACVTTAGVWLLQRDASAGPPSGDCAVVEQLGHEWLAMTSSVHDEMATGPGGQPAWQSVADQEAAMAVKISTAATAVSASSLKEQLNKWAEAAELTAKLQRDSANRSPGADPSESEGQAFVASSVMTYEATAALRDQCPDMPVQPPDTP
ncbi:hypothetical protein XA26_10720 [Mycolicibacterium fortuitum]|uniref:Uncharacterized protein n=2 Tax=Mycolicibacterium fortuitum TaxID=1766 RepID=A0A0N9Y6F1_MYCFO|nr:hypothetical protein [Mycolicibacterium fortuitum]ALI24929.1 hypothetical protein XA26_10720 [Mycolicibacterium fortuitum]NOQ62288.1 hypothetical protein [Mycolicibacterium fortuitum]